ncbi:MAG: hypothetical protein FP825_06570 [Hyphomonas sp.]|uniref:hypothetical protein n=1 Tax=Hyphomonas sp. TaxID=87 RepID=UPI0017B46092|nr:hypothetical protein [Hyphomonas sp.]MBA3068123.1 hypothetical protein [Hyphomonas sp.]MBU3922066.1 hypothetical protein [Alphaproteobacteria bacterium]MBU4061142.1 hypothetical protein [Alphaproteobacteria bacterium]MBU4162866.1 hypothetical protein [Alphaproteobacteria bacterium]
MTPTEQLREVLKQQSIDPEGPEIAEMAMHKQAIERILYDSFGSTNLTIRYAGSRAKHTMIKAEYDLDIVAYFNHDSTIAGRTLKEIYWNVSNALRDSYEVTPNRSSLRLFSAAFSRAQYPLQIDVVPGKFQNNENYDCSLHQTTGDKDWLKTNLETHIDWIRQSNAREALKLMKIARVTQGLLIRQFPLDLIVIRVLRDKQHLPLADQFVHVLTEISTSTVPIRVYDPANSENDLSGLTAGPVWTDLALACSRMLLANRSQDWLSILGDPSKFAPSSPAIIRAETDRTVAPIKPWAR